MALSRVKGFESDPRTEDAMWSAVCVPTQQAARSKTNKTVGNPGGGRFSSPVFCGYSRQVPPKADLGVITGRFRGRGRVTDSPDIFLPVFLVALRKIHVISPLRFYKNKNAYTYLA